MDSENTSKTKPTFFLTNSVHNMEQIKDILPKWRQELKTNSKEFKQFYSFAFQYSRIEGQKSICKNFESKKSI
jgi:hypothetical protein